MWSRSIFFSKSGDYAPHSLRKWHPDKSGTSLWASSLSALGEVAQTYVVTEANDRFQQTFAWLVIKENLLQIGKNGITEGKNQLMAEWIVRAVTKARALYLRKRKR